ENDNLTTIYTDIKDLQNLSKFLESKNIKIESAEIRYIPKETVCLTDEQNKSMENLIRLLEDNDDVVDWWGNF
ncbi:YebC/PmpR family DNA-binding transcriptional regulator, partial [Patescibacteria group bacterium]|nr:YebC/PmpR family DNA-binding transcriptional regulator [Patescibacteria group bacterium]